MGILDRIFRPALNTQNVLTALDEINLSPYQIKSEKTVERIIAENLAKKFGAEEIHRQYSIPGYWGMKVDIDLGDGLIGIELKLASSLAQSASNVQRLFGQAIYYDTRLYQGNLIIVVVGNAGLSEMPFMREIETQLHDIDVEFYYLATKKTN